MIPTTDNPVQAPQRKKKANVSLDDETCSNLKSVVDHFNNEDRGTRERQIRQWRRLKLYWNSFSQIYWSETAQDYKLYNNREIDSNDSNQDYYDRPVNVFKAFLETIIAALSIQIPAISCTPDDADNPLDLSTAKAGDKIAELVYKHNNVMFLWLHALYVYCTEGMIACYSYSKEDKSFGTYSKPKYKDEEVDAYQCPSCQARVPDFLFSDNEINEFGPGDDDSALHSEINENGPVCLECGVNLDPELQKTKLIIPRLVGTTQELKSRIALEVYGGLYIKVANYAKCQADTPYLIFSHETHYSTALEAYPNLWEKIPHGGWTTVGVNDPYEQYGRVNPQYRGEFPNEVVTVKISFLRPSSFNILEEEIAKKLKKKFPDGCRVDMVNDIVADYCNESLDDSWTLTQNPMSDFLNHEPLGELLTNIQDITNDLISLTLQTIEHGIEQTWADPAVVNFSAQRQMEAQPGTLIPTKPLSGSKSVSEAFYSSKTASLSPEVFNFYQIIQQLGQFVSGALPSLFGGQQGAGSSGTASEYAMSKGMALQRLQTPWKMMTIWWKEIFGKVIPMYMKNMVDDERIVEKNEQGNFINVFIRKAEVDGTIGAIELEPDEKLPVSDEQQADMIMQLMQLNNQEITTALMDPENLPFIAKAIKIPEFRLPGSDDRQKQYEEINELINSVPIIQPPNPVEMQQAQMSGQPLVPNKQPSVPIDPDVDNHAVEAAICRSWLISLAGRQCKTENPDGYENVLLHMKAHMAIVQQQTAAAQAIKPEPPKVTFSFNGADVAGNPQIQSFFDNAEQIPPPAVPQASDLNLKPTLAPAAPVKKPAESEKVTGAANARQPIS